MDDLQSLFESFEPLGHRRERHTQRYVLLLVPSGANAEHGAPSG
ncbi:MAG TPA: hypothetical protein VIQ02_15780 [Jiangellaceae bacterium]